MMTASRTVVHFTQDAQEKVIEIRCALRINYKVLRKAGYI
jgi:hypothetical protein